MRYHLIALGIVIAAATPLSAQPVYRLHDNGSIWVNTAPCSGASCPWVLLDNNPNTREITASGVPAGGFQSHKAPPDAPALYQRRADGTIWLYNGKPCDGASCPGWQMLDKNQQTVSIVAAGFPDPENLILYKRHNDGEIWRYTQTPCKGASCPGWERLDKNPKTQEIIAAGTHLYQRHNDGAIWHYKGTPCKGDLCPGWERLDDNKKTVEITAAAVGNDDVPMLYKRDDDGAIWRYTGPSCSGASCWQLLDNNKAISIVTSSHCLYQLRDNGSIWVYVSPPRCGGAGPGWQPLDNNPRTRRIAAGPRSLYQLHDNGAIWRYSGPPWCSGASCWQLLYDPTTWTILSTRN